MYPAAFENANLADLGQASKLIEPLGKLYQPQHGN